MSGGRASVEPGFVAGMRVAKRVELIKPLGAGGMGAVWLADHTGLKRQVVVKFMLAGLDANQSAVKRFTREAEAAAQVRSPHVVTIHDHGFTDSGVPFIVMEHLEGRDLGALLDERKVLEPAEVITIVSQVAKALAKVHAAGLLHRDIKPDNIFLCEGEDDLFAKLLDFGIAKSADGQQQDATLDGETKTGQVVGTPYYMSPEQVTAQKAIDARCDLWALGVVTFEALTGTRPFDGPSFGALAVKIATGNPPKPSEVNPALPAAFDAWFAKACARDPDERFGSARELAKALRAAFDGVVSVPASRVSGDSSGERSIPARAASGRAPTPTELASTVNQDTPDPSADPPVPRGALARSEGGAAVAVDEKPASKKGTSKIVLAVVALTALTGGVIALGKRAETETATATASARSASEVVAKDMPPPVETPVTAIPSAAAAAAASAAPSAEPSAEPSASASAKSAAAAAPVKHASVAPPKPAPAPPAASSSASSKPDASAKKASPATEPDLY